MFFCHMKKITLVLLLSFITTTAIAQNASVQGSVVDIEKLPLPGAVITETVSGQSTVTNDLGQFTLTGLGRGKASIQITSTGYQDYTKQLDLKSGEVKDLLVQMKVVIDDWIHERQRIKPQAQGAMEVNMVLNISQLASIFDSVRMQYFRLSYTELSS